MKFLRVALVSVVALVLLALAGLYAWRWQPDPGAVVYLGGPVITLDPTNRVVAALGTQGGRIVAVGSEAELREWSTEHGARVVDLAGRALLPGFIEAHGHYPGAGMRAIFVDLNSPPIGSVERIDDLVARIAARAEQTEPGRWILGIGYDDSLLEEGRHPTREDLDRASHSHPVAVLHVSGHLASVSTSGLVALGIDATTPDPEGGVIRREPGSKQPDGVLEEKAIEGVRAIIEFGAFELLRLFEHANESYLSQGVTTAQIGAADLRLMRAADWLSWLRLVEPRLVVWPMAEAADAILSGAHTPSSWDRERVRVGAVKLIADGSIQGYTGYLSEPYHVPPGDDPAYRGYPRIPRDGLFALVERFHAAGRQLAIHGNGDAAIEDILDAIEHAQQTHPRRDARHVVIHAQMTRDDQLDRMKALGVIPSFFSLHTFYWGDRHRRLFMGPERAARMSPAAGALERGLRFTIHADDPIVPYEPLRLVWSAVNRTTRSGYTVGPDQRIPVLEALRAVTIDAAYQHFEEADKGSLEPGKLADLVIVSRSPLEVDPATIDEIRVEETVIGGRSVWRRGD